MSALRIAGCSGAVCDRIHAMARIAKNEDVHVIFGDWMSEGNMTKKAAEKVRNGPDGVPYEPSFLQALEPALEDVARKNIKIVCNAGASGTELLAKRTRDLVKTKGLNLSVAWLEGDELDIDTVLSQNSKLLNHATNNGTLESWPFKPFYAQCYLGPYGIATALSKGADIVICGRVADPSPVMGAAIWYHSWQRTEYDKLAQALLAGHLIECSNYVTGGNWTGFKALGENVYDLAYPIAEIGKDGDVLITMESNPSLDGNVTIETCKSQVLYEIQGPLYFNSDVTLNLENIKFDQVGKNKVRVSGSKGYPPPSTTKLGLTAHGGYQAEIHYYATGLDAYEKARMLELQSKEVLNEKEFSTLDFSINGSVQENAPDQNAATVDIRVFAQAPNKEALAFKNFVQKFTVMQSYPGATPNLDRRQAFPKEYYEYYVTLIEQSLVKQTVHMLDSGIQINVPVPPEVQKYPALQNSYETSNPVDLNSFGPTTEAPLGYIVHARSGDKSSNCNVGFYVRNADEWDWLRSLLTIDKIKELLDEEYKPGNTIQRFELGNIWAVHFLLVDHLDRGVNSTSTYDCLGKNVAEYLRCKYVDIPNKFLARGKI